MKPMTMTASTLKNSRKKLMSSEGAANELYWPTDEVRGESPAGASIKQAELKQTSGGDGYFQVSTRRGDNVAGSAYDYIINGNMIAAFALIAWPAKSAETGRHHFHGEPEWRRLRGRPRPGQRGDRQIYRSFQPDDNWEITGD